MSYVFYRAFEDRHRGSRELIKRRLTAYLPFVEPLLDHYPAAAAVDLGCGRGEWLEVLAGLGFNPVGIDLDTGMLSACHELGLAVEQSDAIAYLAALSDESQVVVSAFHVVEHITFDQLRTLITEALRVLKPGGTLIMETPNPENIVVATRNFYLDPTHLRPIPPELLSFVPEYYGFKRVKTIRLQESKELMQCETPSLLDVFQGVSPDYAVVAQKDAVPLIIGATAMAFNSEYGLTFETLSARYDNATQLKIQQAENKAQQAGTKAQQAEVFAQQAESKAQQAESKAQQAESIAQQAESKAQQAESKAQQAETKAQQAEAFAQQAETLGQRSFAQTQALLNSTSWRITAPLRSISGAVRRLASAIRERRLVSGIKRRLRTVIRW
jgi:O-antigen chain-terminating methyltransferase